MSDRVARRLLTTALISSMSLGAVACTGAATNPRPTSDQGAQATQGSPAYSGGTTGHTGEASADRSPTGRSAGPDNATNGSTAPLAPTTTAPDQCTDSEGKSLIDSASWIQLDGRPSLEVVPTGVLRDCRLRDLHEPAWRELLRIAPGADTAGMQEQFTCHVLFAPGKAVWHLEPWRPVVTGAELVARRCNPGGADPDLP